MFPVKDTVITNACRPNGAQRATGSNQGGSEELSIFKISGISGVVGTLSASSLGRSLLQFDFTQFNSLTGSGVIPTAGMTFILRMNHRTVACTLPASFDAVVRVVASGWDEGTGKDGSLGDRGYANWIKRTSTLPWSTPGGDFAPTPTVTAHFDTGTEDLEVDVTQIVSGWLNGSVENNGLAVTMTSSIEADSVFVDYYRKAFYSRQTDFVDRVPYIEARVSDFVRDDRSNMQFSRTGSLWLYNLVGGIYQDLPASPVVVSISDSSGTLVHVTASHMQVGAYSASFALPTGSYSGSVFYDSWGAGSLSFMTGAFRFVDSGPVQAVPQGQVTARIRNLSDEYFPEDVAVFDVLFRRRPHSLPVFQTASLGPQTPLIVENAYYAIVNDSTQERVIAFGTGSTGHTRLSYGQAGNSFKLFMRNLHRGNVYRIVFLVSEQGHQQFVDNGLRFKVV